VVGARRSGYGGSGGEGVMLCVVVLGNCGGGFTRADGIKLGRAVVRGIFTTGGKGSVWWVPQPL